MLLCGGSEVVRYQSEWKSRKLRDWAKSNLYLEAFPQKTTPLYNHHLTARRNCYLQKVLPRLRQLSPILHLLTPPHPSSQPALQPPSTPHTPAMPPPATLRHPHHHPREPLCRPRRHHKPPHPALRLQNHPRHVLPPHRPPIRPRSPQSCHLLLHRP